MKFSPMIDSIQTSLYSDVLNNNVFIKIWKDILFISIYFLLMLRYNEDQIHQKMCKQIKSKTRAVNSKLSLSHIVREKSLYHKYKKKNTRNLNEAKYFLPNSNQTITFKCIDYRRSFNWSRCNYSISKSI